MTGRLVVHRPRRVQNLFGVYVLEVDGRKVATVGWGRRVTVELDPGVHEVRVRLNVLAGEMGYCGSAPWSVEIVDSEAVVLQALPLLPPTPITAALDGGSAYTPEPEAWLTLVPVEANDDHDR